MYSFRDDTFSHLQKQLQIRFHLQKNKNSLVPRFAKITVSNLFLVSLFIRTKPELKSLIRRGIDYEKHETHFWQQWWFVCTNNQGGETRMFAARVFFCLFETLDSSECANLMANSEENWSLNIFASGNPDPNKCTLPHLPGANRWLPSSLLTPLPSGNNLSFLNNTLAHSLISRKRCRQFCLGNRYKLAGSEVLRWPVNWSIEAKSLL